MDEVIRTQNQIKRDDRTDAIIGQIIDSTGDIDSWLDEVYTIRELNGNLIIKATPEVHQEIFTLIANLRQSQAAHYQRQAVLIEAFLLLKRAEAHRLAQEYDVALGLIAQALAVDPANPQAVALKAVIAATQSRME